MVKLNQLSIGPIVALDKGDEKKSNLENWDQIEYL